MKRYLLLFIICLLCFGNAKAQSITITDAAGLQAMASNLNGDFILGADIDLTGITWTPVGTSSTPFAGTFDGNNHKIIGLKINSPGSDYVGLFGYTNASVSGNKIQRIYFVDCEVTGQDHVGILAGYAYGDSLIDISILNSKVTGRDQIGILAGVVDANPITRVLVTNGTVEGRAQVGGLVGMVEYSSTDELSYSYVSGQVNGETKVGGLVGVGGYYTHNCYTTCDVSATQDIVGGLVGANVSSIGFCYASGSVSGRDYVGGIAGQNDDGAVFDSYATGNVSGAYNVGGIAGANLGTYGGSLYDTYASGSVSGTENVGGLVGHNFSVGYINNSVAINSSISATNGPSTEGRIAGLDDGGGNINDNYALATLSPGSGTTTDKNGANQTDADLKKQITYEALYWDFTIMETWGINEDASYPYLKDLPVKQLSGKVLPESGTLDLYTIDVYEKTSGSLVITQTFAAPDYTVFVPEGDYLIYASGEGYFSAYYTVASPAIHWSGAATVTVSGDTQIGTITLKPVSNPGAGSVTISGNVQYAGPKATMARPVAYATVILYGKPRAKSSPKSMVSIAADDDFVAMEQTRTDQDGNFSFTNLTADYLYRLYIEMPSYTMVVNDFNYIIDSETAGQTQFNINYLASEQSKTIYINSENPDFARIDDAISIKLYPNPAESVIHISMDIDISFIVRIYNSSGQQMIVANGTSRETLIDVSRFRPGVYFVRVEIAGKAGVYKFVKK